jgi:glutamyl/glutaminyl-tRNA synthetase
VVRSVTHRLLHVGGAKTALYNRSRPSARRQKVLRIEDTDAERNCYEWIDGILSGARWIG